MRARWCAPLAGLLLSAAAAGASTKGPVTALRAYGPGGPQHVLQEAADLFRERHGATVAIIRASPEELDRKIREDADIYFGGAEYMLEDFARRNPDVLDMQSVELLHPRRIGLLVRKGNPLGIRGIGCLTRDDVELLTVRFENMEDLLPARRDRDITARRSVFSGQEGVQAWRSTPELDAWITYRSWHVSLGAESEFIEIPGDHAVRFTSVALTKRTPHRQAARQFIGFLKSPEARRIFVEHGWD